MAFFLACQFLDSPGWLSTSACRLWAASSQHRFLGQLLHNLWASKDNSQAALIQHVWSPGTQSRITTNQGKYTKNPQPKMIVWLPQCTPYQPDSITVSFDGAPSFRLPPVKNALGLHSRCLCCPGQAAKARPRCCKMFHMVTQLNF